MRPALADHSIYIYVLGLGRRGYRSLGRKGGWRGWRVEDRAPEPLLEFSVLQPATATKDAGRRATVKQSVNGVFQGVTVPFPAILL